MTRQRAAGRLRFLAPEPPKDLTLPAELYHMTLEHMSDGILVADTRVAGQPILYVNPAFEAITGYSSAEAIGKNCRYLQGSDHLQPEISEIRQALADGRTCSVTLRNYRRDSSMFRNYLRLVPCCGADGDASYCLGIIRDVTNVQGVDRLTSMADRYGLLDQLRAIASERSGPMVVIKTDIAGFHEINSGFGYDMGDAVLRVTAERLQQVHPAAVGRIGADEFACAFILGRIDIRDSQMG